MDCKRTEVNEFGGRNAEVGVLKYSAWCTVCRQKSQVEEVGLRRAQSNRSGNGEVGVLKDSASDGSQPNRCPEKFTRLWRAASLIEKGTL